MVYGRSITAQRHRHSTNLTVLAAHLPTGSRDALHQKIVYKVQESPRGLKCFNYFDNVALFDMDGLVMQEICFGANLIAQRY